MDLIRIIYCTRSLLPSPSFDLTIQYHTFNYIMPLLPLPFKPELSYAPLSGGVVGMGGVTGVGGC